MKAGLNKTKINLKETKFTLNLFFLIDTANLPKSNAFCEKKKKKKKKKKKEWFCTPLNKVLTYYDTFSQNCEAIFIIANVIKVFKRT